MLIRYYKTNNRPLFDGIPARFDANLVEPSVVRLEFGYFIRFCVLDNDSCLRYYRVIHVEDAPLDNGSASPPGERHLRSGSRTARVPQSQ